MLAVAAPSSPSVRAPLLPQGVVFQAQCRSAVALVQERRIEFVPARNQSVSVRTNANKTSTSDASDADAIHRQYQNPTLRIVLVPEKTMTRLLHWRNAHKIGPGFSNLGNTCYLNSVLQCLSYTPCLVQYLLRPEVGTVFQIQTSKASGSGPGKSGPGLHLSMKHPQQSNRLGFCTVRALARLAGSVHASSGSSGLKHSNSNTRVLQPRDFVLNIRHLAKHFRIGRQEDAHEFFRLVLDGLQKACLQKAKIAKETDPMASKTFVHQVFRGQLRNSLQCAKCHFVSERMDEFFDLSLEIDAKIASLSDAIRHFTATETLDAHNAWTCSRCKQPSRAEKGMTIEQCPNVLVVQFKRFDGFYGKIKKYVTFPTSLDLRIGMRPDSPDRRNGRTKYELHAVLVHAGHSTNGGHYYAFVRGSSGQWYEMNDECVRWVSRDTVLQQRAYMLFYSRVLPESDDDDDDDDELEARAKAKSEAKAMEKKAESNSTVKTGTDAVTIAATTADPAKVAVQSNGDANGTTNGSAKSELTMATFLQSLRTESQVPSKDDKATTATSVAPQKAQQAAPSSTLVTYTVSVASTPSVTTSSVPVFTGAFGKFNRFAASWVPSATLHMATKTTTTSVPVTTTAAVARPLPAPASTSTATPINPKTLRQVGAKTSAVYGKQIAAWNDDDPASASEAATNDLVAKHDAVLQHMRKEDWGYRRAHRKSSWDEGLDTGRVKKVKKRSAFVANEGANNAFFQRAVQHKKQRH